MTDERQIEKQLKVFLEKTMELSENGKLSRKEIFEQAAKESGLTLV